MSIEHIHSYLVRPGKNSDGPSRIGGAIVPLSGQIFGVVEDVYRKSDAECSIEISFDRESNGIQRNPCRDLVLAYIGEPSLENGRNIATTLESVTDRRSGVGLLFLILGSEGSDKKLIISRFPTNSAILAEEDQNTLSIEYLERVFMKSHTSYKAVLYRASSLTTGFWLGRAVDRQLNDRAGQPSDYWISDFLKSGFRTTAAAATRRLAKSLQAAAKKASDLTVKREIAAAVTLASSLGRERLSIDQFGQRFNLSEPSKAAIAAEFKSPTILAETFEFDRDEFCAQVAYRTVEMDTGGLLTAPSSEFENVFHRVVLDEQQERVRFLTEGKIVSEKVGKAK